MSDETLNPALWKPRSVDDTVAIYRDWAATYDADVLGSGYVTPQRLAVALAQFVEPTRAVLDFGCGTGLSGMALTEAGFSHVDGTDVTPEMLDIAQKRAVYRDTWLSGTDGLSIAQNAYDVICAAGVVSLGAAPPDMLRALLDVLPAQGHLAFSYNDPTLAEQSYQDALSQILDDGRATLLFREHGPHLPEKNMGSEVIILQKA